MNFTNFEIFLTSQFELFFKEMNKVALTVNIFEILILGFVLYYLYRRFIRGTHSENLVRGSLLLVVMWGLSELLIRINLNIFGVFLKTLVSVVSFGLIVIFQPELRRFLGYIGQGNLFEKLFLSGSEQIGAKQLDTAKELIETIKYLSKSKTGGLIVLQKDVTSLVQSDVGVKINANVSQELLLTIFFPNTPLHDGAVVIRDNKIVSAGVLLPLTEDPKLSWRYGTRHRAAIGVSEVYPDCACIVVSEETGDVSIAIDGILKKYDDLGKLKADLTRILGHKQEETQQHEKSFIKFDNIFGKNL
ncbi:MAG: diadenylate cyclase CdaA [Candidatus Gastranaerophilales bacterium]|nr:diadenylate cyclase CdaA [Candidatus Gastranaerophilales bacterium]